MQICFYFNQIGWFLTVLCHLKVRRKKFRIYRCHPVFLLIQKSFQQDDLSGFQMQMTENGCRDLAIILFWLTLLLFYVQHSVPSQIGYSINYKYITNNEILQILHTTFCMHVWTKAFLTLSGNFYRFSGFSQTPSVGSKWKRFLNLASSLGEYPLFSIVTLRVGVGTGRDRGSNIFILGRFTIEWRKEQRKKLW